MSEANKYYAHACYVDDELKYVGMGQVYAYRHCNSGSSSCADLNKDFYEGKKIEVKSCTRISLKRKQMKSKRVLSETILTVFTTK